jgi:hypothetical protein
VLSERGDDGALLSAVEAYKAALEERTRDRVPLEWAETQTKLGAALRVLGAHSGDDAKLQARRSSTATGTLQSSDEASIP